MIYNWPSYFEAEFYLGPNLSDISLDIGLTLSYICSIVGD
jgi:hypothetical protein